jgi:predicted permease
VSIFSIIFPLVFIVLVGFISTKTKFLTQQHIAGISKFTFYMSIPAFLFLNMAQANLQKGVSLNGFLTFYIPVVSIFFVGVLVDRFLITKHNNYSRHSVFALGSSYSNTVLVGLPIIIAAMGRDVMGIIFMIITFHSMLLFSLTFLLSTKGTQAVFSWQQFLKNMLLNPVVLSISLGLLLNITGLLLPLDIVNALDLLSAPAIGCALFVLGGNLTFYKMSDNWKNAFIATFLKLLLLPSLVMLLGKFVFALTPQLLSVLVLLSASPLGVNAYLIANQIKQHQATLASTVVLSTVLSGISFTFWLAVLL